MSATCYVAGVISQPIVSADPATDAEAAYKESQNKWKSAHDAVTKFVDSGASTDPAITGLQSTFQEKKAQLKADLQTKEQVPVLAPGRPFRVLARKHKDKNEWLVVAWTAEISSQPGIYDATVTIPGAGQVTVQARKGGSLYLDTLKDGQPVLKQLDPDETDPTSSFR